MAILLQPADFNDDGLLEMSHLGPQLSITQRLFQRSKGPSTRLRGLRSQILLSCSRYPATED